MKGLDTHGAAGPAVVKPAAELTDDERKQIAASEAKSKFRPVLK